MSTLKVGQRRRYLTLRDAPGAPSLVIVDVARFGVQYFAVTATVRRDDGSRNVELSSAAADEEIADMIARGFVRLYARENGDLTTRDVRHLWSDSNAIVETWGR